MTAQAKSSRQSLSVMADAAKAPRASAKLHEGIATSMSLVSTIQVPAMTAAGDVDEPASNPAQAPLSVACAPSPLADGEAIAVVELAASAAGNPLSLTVSFVPGEVSRQQLLATLRSAHRFTLVYAYTPTGTPAAAPLTVRAGEGGSRQAAAPTVRQWPSFKAADRAYRLAALTALGQADGQLAMPAARAAWRTAVQNLIDEAPGDELGVAAAQLLQTVR